MIPPPNWLPPGKSAAVCFTIDDVHPGRSTDAYEAGGDLAGGALGHVEWLLTRHPGLRVTLFTTPDWREISPRPTRKLLARVPVLRDRMFLADVLPKGTMRLDRHPAFVSYLKGLPRTEVGLHGLHHIHRGPAVLIEFQNENASECEAILSRALSIFEDAGLPKPTGMTPPGWHAPRALLEAMARLGFCYISSARDIRTPVAPEAVTAMSGLQGVSLVQPEMVAGGRLVHIPSNFQATSEIDRAMAIVAAGGLLSVKAHIIKTAMGYVQLDGMDVLYRNYLDTLFATLEDRFGDHLWWTTMGEVASRVFSAAPPSSEGAA
jgi:Uncharacterized protein conserved in bacteria (DUF2334)